MSKVAFERGERFVQRTSGKLKGYFNQKLIVSVSSEIPHLGLTQDQIDSYVDGMNSSCRQRIAEFPSIGGSLLNRLLSQSRPIPDNIKDEPDLIRLLLSGQFVRATPPNGIIYSARNNDSIQMQLSELISPRRDTISSEVATIIVTELIESVPPLGNRLSGIQSNRERQVLVDAWDSVIGITPEPNGFLKVIKYPMKPFWKRDYD